MSEIIKGITNDRLETLFLHGHEARPHEVAVMAGELIEHRKCKDCDGVHDGGCVNTNEAKEVKPAALANQCPVNHAALGQCICGKGHIGNHENAGGQQWIESVKQTMTDKPAAPEVEPWVQFPDHPRWDTAITEAIYQLQRRIEAVERSKA